MNFNTVNMSTDTEAKRLNNVFLYLWPNTQKSFIRLQENIVNSTVHIESQQPNENRYLHRTAYAVYSLQSVGSRCLCRMKRTFHVVSVA